MNAQKENKIAEGSASAVEEAEQEERKSIVEIAEEMRNAFEQIEKNGEEIWITREGTDDWIIDIIYNVHKNVGDRLPCNSIYNAIEEALCIIENCEVDAEEDEIREALEEIEPDMYTSDLIAWLGESEYNIYYLDEAMGYTQNGFELLSEAQRLFKVEVANALLDELVRYKEAKYD